MDGKFLPKKIFSLTTLVLLGGFFSLGLSVFLGITGEFFPGLLIQGILCLVLAIPAMLLNHGAYIRVEADSIHAKFNWFGKLDCRLDEVAFVSAGINTLTILMKDGRRYLLGELSNSFDLASAIRKNIFAPETKSPDRIRKELTQMQATQQRLLYTLIGGSVLLFVNIFITVLLTGGRDIAEFGKPDWVIFGIMCFAELITAVFLFRAAIRYGKRKLFLNHLHYRLRSALIASPPLPSNNVRKVYTDEYCTGRVCVCGYPNDESVYYDVQIFTNADCLTTTRTSEVFDTMDDLLEDAYLNDLFPKLIDITPAFIPQ